MFRIFFGNIFGMIVWCVVAKKRSLLGPFSHASSCFSAIVILLFCWFVFLLIFDRSWLHENVTGYNCSHFFDLDTQGFFGRSLASFWHPSGSILVAVRTLRAPFWLRVRRFGSNFWLLLSKVCSYFAFDLRTCFFWHIPIPRNFLSICSCGWRQYPTNESPTKQSSARGIKNIVM